MFRRVMLYFDTVRHLRPGQIAGRLRAASRSRLLRPRAVALPANLEGRLNPQAPFIPHDPWNSRERLRQGEVCFLNQPQSLGWPVNWNVAELPLLWQFNLHYFGYLHLLEPSEQIEICTDWIAANALGSQPAWHPYPTSLRLVSWCKANPDSKIIAESIYQQAAFLFRRLETYHPGNHLLENARALVFAGSFFAGRGEAPRWLEKGLEIYRRETPVQVLADGGYFERSPMYHALMLEGYLDVINILDTTHPARPVLIDAARRMADFLFSVTNPAGHIALFNDATQEIAPPTSALLQYAERLTGHSAQKLSAFPESGYFIHQDSDVFLIIDGGRIGPSFLPAHAHADIFSYELSLRGHPFVVDSGVYEYQQGEMRRYVRSTRAHNTVTVDGQDQAECWGSFRVARRFDPKEVSFTTDSGESRFAGRFDGYAKLVGDGIVHERRIIQRNDQRQIQVIDSVKGQGKHLAESMLHFHPGVALAREDNRIMARNGGVACTITVEQGRIAIEDGWYCPRFGVKERNKVIAISDEVPCDLVYTISY